ncbi:MAG: hypothetical protein ACPLKP_01320 [Microgenomates group bacterium]
MKKEELTLKKIGNKVKIDSKFLIFLVLFLGILSLGTKILFLYVNSTAFTYDQARDLLDIREIVFLRKPRLIGPTTSLQGVFYGPTWYWIAIPFFILTKGHPLSFLIMNLFVSFLLPFLFFLLFEDKKTSIFLLVLYFFSFPYLQKSVYALNVNPIVFLFPLFLLFLFKTINNEKIIYLKIALFLIALSFHFEPVDGVIWLLTMFLVFLIFRKLRFLFKNIKSWFFFLIPFLPQLLFDLRHNFIQTKAILFLLSGKANSLSSANMDLLRRLIERFSIFKNYFLTHFPNHLFFFVFLILFFVIFLIKERKKEKNLFLILLIALFANFCFFVIYPYNLWVWYFGTLDAIFITLLGLTIGFIFWEKKSLIFKVLLAMIFIFYLWWDIKKYLPTKLEKAFIEDPGNLRTRLMAIDSIYTDANNKGMKIYSFTPYVYDYPYQYLIWWRAKTKYKYLPEDYSYLPNQVDYVPGKKKIDAITPSKRAECIYLIIEPQESQENWFKEWRGNFEKEKVSWKIGKIKIEKLCN